MPKLHAIQAEAVMPLAAAFMKTDWTPGATTIAGGIAVGSPPRLRQALRAIRESGGTSIAVTDASIIRWQKLLAAREGIFAEPTSAAAFAGTSEAGSSKASWAADEVALVPVTGFRTQGRASDVIPIHRDRVMKTSECA